MTDVFLFTIDALRKDAINDDCTPFLSKIEEQSLTFENAVATGSGTSSAFPGLLAGVLPLDYGYASLRDEHTTIPEALPNRIDSCGISSSTPTSRLYNFDSGFNHFEDDESYSIGSKLKERIRNSYIVQNSDTLFKAGEKILSLIRTSTGDDNSVPYMSAESVTNSVIECVRLSEGDTFLWAHYMEPHTPYYPPKEDFPDREHPELSLQEVNVTINEYNHNKPPIYGDRTAGRELSEEEMYAFKYYYDAETTHVDRQLKRAYEAIASRCDDFVLILCADHGEEFGEHGHHGHPPKLYDELVNVPLLIHGEGVDADTIQDPVSTTRVPATVADIFGVSVDSDWRGGSLLSAGSDGPDTEYALAELSHHPNEGLGGQIQPEKAKIAVRGSRWKCIYDAYVDEYELYDIENEPDEQRNVVDTHEAKHSEFESIVSERLDEISATGPVNDELSSDVENRLEELGYIDS